MKLIMGGVNGHYLRNITENYAQDSDEVLAAVAYATDVQLLFEWCWTRRIPLKYYGRLDDGVAVSIPILNTFLKRKSANFVCRLVQHHHAKVIWWRGVGAYIGSANLTGNGWYKNVEAGCFIADSELTDEMANDLFELFSTLDSNATPLTAELLKEMESRSRILATTKPSSENFWKSPSFTIWPGLVQTNQTTARSRQRQAFLQEWHSTLQELRVIATRVSLTENRPSWISGSASPGAQADQFLHAHYYQRTFQGRKAIYAELFERNKTRRDNALDEAMNWWRDLSKAPSAEDNMLNVTAPFLRSALTEEHLTVMTYEQFHEICACVHAIKDYARRVPNKAVGLPSNGTTYTILEKVSALSKRIWNDRTSNGARVNELICNILYGGTGQQLPERIWLALTDPKWKIEGLGVSALGELVGWALPDQFPPRNGRTSKALRSLGFEVTVHVQ